MTERISGGSFDVNYDSIMIHVENATVTITDNSAVAQSRGIPNGHTKGSVSADVEVEVDSQNFKVYRRGPCRRFLAIHSGKGLFVLRQRRGRRRKIEVFGCVPTLSDIVNINPNEASKTTKKIKFMVTSPDFVAIDGVPYLSARDTRDLKG